MTQMTIKLKRAYDAPAPADGTRVLVDRLWPRGVSKDRAHLDLWLKEIAPSTELRKWFNHDRAKYAEFHRRYLIELDTGHAQSALVKLRELAAQGPLTLIYAAKDSTHNEAVILSELLEQP